MKMASWGLAAHSAATETHAQSSAAVWYRKSRALEIMSAYPRDSVVLTAVGRRADRLAISMSCDVDGVVKHRQRWTSEGELYDADPQKTPVQLATFMQARLDDILVTVKREPINRELVKHMGDAPLLRRIVLPVNVKIVVA